MYKLIKFIFRLGYNLAAKEILADRDIFISDFDKEKIQTRYIKPIK